MAKSTCTVHITLELDRDEATWLRALLQNPINHSNLEDIRDAADEDPQDCKYREAIFAAIPSERDTYF